MKSTVLLLTIFTSLTNLTNFVAKIPENVSKNNGLHPYFLKSLNLDNSL